MSQSREQAASHLPELTDSDLDAVSGGTGADGESGGLSPKDFLEVTVAATEVALLTSSISKAIGSASEGAKKVASP